MNVRIGAALAALCFAAGCAGSSGIVPNGSIAAPAAQRDRISAGQFSGVQIAPADPGYLRGDAAGLRLWGSTPRALIVRALDSSGKPVTGAAAPAISIVSKSPSRLSVAAGATNGRFILSAATTADSNSACPACPVVRPGNARLAITLTPKAGKAQHIWVTVTVAHKIVAVSLNPNPNPNIGGTDAVMQYYDDNVKPSVIWDDIILRNDVYFPNVTGLAFGADGSFYIANSGLLGYPGGVTKYAAASDSPVPVGTFTSPNLLSPAGIALDARDNLYVADNGFETVTRFSKGGSSVTIAPTWEAGADVTGVAVDGTRGELDVAMTGVGTYAPPKAANVGRIVVLPLTFKATTTALRQIDSTAKNGVNEPYGVAIDTLGRLFVVNDYVSIVQGPPGPGPEFSTLTRYGGAIVSSSTLPDATVSKRLIWPLAVATDVAGTVYVANSTPPKNNGTPGKIYVLQYDGAFKSGAKSRSTIDLSAGMPAAYLPYLMNVEGIAVDPSPLR
jgi:hypothetical protein